jgi:hypothetical protein
MTPQPPILVLAGAFPPTSTMGDRADTQDFAKDGLMGAAMEGQQTHDVMYGVDLYILPRLAGHVR